MEWVEFRVRHEKPIQSLDIDSCQLFGCQYHEISLSINDEGQVFTSSNEDTIDLKFPQPIAQIIVSCQQDSEICQFYFRSVTCHVYEWSMSISQQHLRKRSKLDNGSAERVVTKEYTLISENIHHIMLFDRPGVLLFSNHQVQHYSSETNNLKIISQFNPSDIDITCHQYFERLDVCYNNFFSLNLIQNGLVFGTRDGSIYWRDFGKDPAVDTKIFVFEGSEKAKFLDLLCVPSLSKDLNTLIVIGDRGTIMIYSKAPNDPNETGVSFKQFNIQGPIYSIEKAHKNMTYLITSGIGRISILNIKIVTTEVELESTYMKSTHHKFKHARMCNSSDCSFEALCDNVTMMNIKYNSTPVSIATNPGDISLLIRDTLAELEFSELTVRSLDSKEQELNQKLSSTNRTLYALRSINSKRQIGVCNSLELTGFEFTVRPITKCESIANCSLHSTSYLRVCIKTSRFLELEDWELSLDFFPQRQSKSSLGETRTVVVMGFESHYENGIERYSIWERDIEIDVKSITLPLKVSATLIMSADEQEKLPLRFPVLEMIVDDIHYAIPCNLDFATSIGRRGLEEISNRLMNSYNNQKLSDKSGRYPFARLMKSKSSGKMIPPKFLLNYKNVNIRCLIDSNMKEETYRSILPSILSEGRTMDDMKSMLQGAEQALFTLTSYPGCPIIIKLSRVSPTMIDLKIQCVYPPALFKTEATLLSRLYTNFIQPSDKNKISPYEEGQQKNIFLKRLRLLEESIIDLQEKYQSSEDQMDIDSCDSDPLWDQLKKSNDLMLSIHNEEPIGYFTI